jgi:hypothetical protein
MENIVLTYHFLNEQKGHSIISKEDWKQIVTEYPNYKEIMMDEKINPFGARPTFISVQLYKNPEFQEIESEIGSIGYLMGTNTTILIGEHLQDIEII